MSKKRLTCLCGDAGKAAAPVRKVCQEADAVQTRLDLDAGQLENGKGQKAVAIGEHSEDPEKIRPVDRTIQLSASMRSSFGSRLMSIGSFVRLRPRALKEDSRISCFQGPAGRDDSQVQSLTAVKLCKLPAHEPLEVARNPLALFSALIERQTQGPTRKLNNR